MKSRERGNAIVYVFICIALFAALTYAMTQMGRNSGTLTKEQATIAAQEIIQTATQFREAIARLKLLNGCTEATISFENATVAGYTNAGAPADKKCHVFEYAGGGLSWTALPAGVTDTTQSAQLRYGDYYFPRNVCAVSIGTGAGTCATDALTTTEDLMIVAPWLSLNVCVAINKLLNVTNPSSAPPASAVHNVTAASMLQYAGTFADGTAIATTAQLSGRMSGCEAGPASGYYTFYAILSPR